ncbi:MAG: helix-turn-helix transcriptional regulator [Candidatus Binatia bacterium]
MSRTLTDYEVFERSSVQNRRLLRQEALILEITEALSEALAREGITKAELANRLGKTKGFVSQILAGGRNLTLRTIADVADALGCQIRVQVVKEGHLRESSSSSSLRTYGHQDLAWQLGRDAVLQVGRRPSKAFPRILVRQMQGAA